MADPFVGRDTELAELAELRARAAEGGGAVVAVTGEAGIGKSAVIRRFLEAATSAGATNLVGSAVADEGMPPFWPWTQALLAAAGSRLDGLSPALLEPDVPVTSAGAGDLPKPASLRWPACTAGRAATRCSSAS